MAEIIKRRERIEEVEYRLEFGAPGARPGYGCFSFPCTPEGTVLEGMLEGLGLANYRACVDGSKGLVSLGVEKVRLTGGEPLLRHDLPTLTAMLARIPGVHDLAMTTNGLLLGKHVEALRQAGLQRITVSLDTLRPERMRDLARTDRHADVLAGIAAARKAGFRQLKLNTVVVRGVNDDELVDLVEFARAQDAEVRFIEYMDVGGATGWTAAQVFSQPTKSTVTPEGRGVSVRPLQPVCRES